MVYLAAYPPEGAGRAAPKTESELRAAMLSGDILEARALRCDPAGSLFFELGQISGFMPFTETGAQSVKNAARLVGNTVCFRVIRADSRFALLSRRLAREETLASLMKLPPGTVIPARVVFCADSGVFVDVGCGVVSLIALKYISISRISSASERFSPGQDIYAVLTGSDERNGRVYLSHRELLGTWEQNASMFSAGDTVCATVRNIMPYGIFLELTPNLSGLAESGGAFRSGDVVSVYIKSIKPDLMKIKLVIVGAVKRDGISPPRYYITCGHIDRWVYSTPGSKKTVETVFSLP